MNEFILHSKLEELGKREARIVHLKRACLGLAILSALPLWNILLADRLGAWSGWMILPLMMLALGAIWFIRMPDLSDKAKARRIEQAFPELNAVLLTAVEKLNQPAAAANVFTQRNVAEAVSHGALHSWVRKLTYQREQRWSRLYIGVWVLLGGLVIWQLLPQKKPAAAMVTTPVLPSASNPVSTLEFKVTPGDTEMERGTKLVVEAAIQPTVPQEATLVRSDLEGNELERVAMRLTVDGDVFGGLMTQVKEDSLYHVEAGGERSKTYQIKTFDCPALERADARITPPAYTKLPPKEIKNTHKVSLLEGSELTYLFKINKPVKEAELYGEDKTSITLRPLANDPLTLTGTFKPTHSQKWRLHLVDAEERANRNPPWMTVTVQANQLAKIEVVFPKRDIQVSSIQELTAEARVSDDLGVLKSGAVFSLAGQTREMQFDHQPTEPLQKVDVRGDLFLEKEKAEPKQLVSYYFWAEDQGPRGETRRSMSDMFFAEVRHFEDIFREQESGPSEPGQPQEGQSDKLVELQKQVINATWRLIRDASSSALKKDDAQVLHDSQQMALEQTKEAMEKAEDTEVRTTLTEAWKSMKDALSPLEQVVEKSNRAPLNQALAFEQSALEWLYRANSREHNVMRQNQPSQAAGQRSNENQLMSLELKQQEQRYEEEKQASDEMTGEQQEQLQVLNRLKELARRQEALAEKMKELENRLQQAKSEQEKEELANQLKRLQDEQEQLLRDLDDLKDRMEKPEQSDSATMAEASKQLEQTREKVEEAAEKLRQQNLADAANAATRAQRDLEQMQEDFRQKTAKRFSEEMKQLKQQSQQVAQRQQAISDALEDQKTPEADPFEDTATALEQRLSGNQVTQAIGKQLEEVNQLLEQMQRISEQAEGNNPLLHRNLYEAVREAQTSSLKENLQEAHEETRYGSRMGAQEAERKATTAVENLQRGIEKAAESVLGSETETLRLAKSELDKLIQAAEQERQGDKGSPQAQSPAEAGGSKANETAEGQPMNASTGETPSKESPPQEAASEAKGELAGTGEPAESPAGQSDKKPSPSSQQGGNPGPSDQGDANQPTGSGMTASSSSPENRPATPNQSASPASNSSGSSQDGKSNAGQEGSRLFFDQDGEAPNNQVFSGSGYGSWSDRLRNVEELLNQPELRNDAAQVLDNARSLRFETQRNNEPPQADQIQARIVQPLAELRNRVAEELAKQGAQQPTVPVDRDPVPPAYRDLVRRYYTELGAGQ